MNTVTRTASGLRIQLTAGAVDDLIVALAENVDPDCWNDLHEARRLERDNEPVTSTDGSLLTAGMLVDGYLGEIAKSAGPLTLTLSWRQADELAAVMDEVHRAQGRGRRTA